MMRVYLHIGVGFDVARFTRQGNAKASECGTSNRYRFPRFFFLNRLTLQRGNGSTNVYFRMKNNRIFKQIVCGLLAGISVLFMASCGSSKPISEQGYDQTGFLDYGFARSYNKGKAYRDALRDAQTNIATRLYRSLSSVDTPFAQDTESGTNLKSISNRTERMVGVIDNAVVNIRNTKEPKFNIGADGIYECEVEVFMDNSMAKQIAKQVYNSLSSEDELRVKFEEQKFIDVYNQELEKYRNSKKN